ncbi:hypothetical protein [Streptomyces sp. AcE210]|nr:hypothetical protein [Streptomyces sp. AcE210]
MSDRRRPAVDLPSNPGLLSLVCEHRHLAQSDESADTLEQWTVSVHEPG